MGLLNKKLSSGEVLRKGLYAKMELFKDIQSFDDKGAMKKPLLDLCDAFHDLMRLYADKQESSIFEHMFHHDGITKKDMSKRPISPVENCPEVVAMRGRGLVAT